VKRTKKILLFSRDPGGANTIIPLVEPLKERRYSVKLYGKDVALNKYKEYGLKGIDINNIIPTINPEGVLKFIENENPDFVITGTSADDYTEKYIWNATEKLNIFSFAILDQWLNYGIRFSKYSVSEYDSYDKDKTYPFLPTKILVLDQYAKNQMIQEGFNSERIIITGNPYFQRLLQRKNEYIDDNIIRKNFGISKNDILITYVSEPICDTYAGNEKYWGYTEKTIFNAVLQSVIMLSKEIDKNIFLIIKLHPKENIKSYSTITESINSKIKILVTNTTESWNLVLASDLICGMTSILLIESVILSKPVVSIQIGLNKEDPFILSKRGILKTIFDRETLIDIFKSILIYKKNLTYTFEVITNPVERVIVNMEKLLCRN
jgi:hypothetical protein